MGVPPLSGDLGPEEVAALVEQHEAQLAEDHVGPPQHDVIDSVGEQRDDMLGPTPLCSLSLDEDGPAVRRRIRLGGRVGRRIGMEDDAHDANGLLEAQPNDALARKGGRVGRACRAARHDIDIARELEADARAEVSVVVRHPGDSDDIGPEEGSAPPVVTVVLGSAIDVEAARGEAQLRRRLPAQVHSRLDVAPVDAPEAALRAPADHA